MLLIDDLLAAPLRGLFFVLREIGEAVQAERAAGERRLMAELTDLHRRIEAGEIGDADFDTAERELLDRLDRLRGQGPSDADGDLNR